MYVSEINCPPDPLPLLNGTIQTTTDWTVNATTTYTCNAGYTPDAGNITCLATGEWETPNCTGKHIYTRNTKEGVIVE